MRTIDRPRYRVIVPESAAEAQRILSTLPEGRWVIDTETDGLRVRSRYHRAHWIGITPLARPNICVTIRAEHFGPMCEMILADKSAKGELVGHNLRFDLHAAGIPASPLNHDTMVLLGFQSTSSHKSLDALAAAKKWPKIGTLPELVAGEKWETNRIHEADPDELVIYLADDCVFTARLYADLWWPPAAEADLEVEWAVKNMEARGLRVLPEAYERFKKAAHGKLDGAFERLVDMGWDTGGNLNSSLQVGRWLQSRNVPLEKTKTGRPATNKVALADLEREGVPEVCALLEFRSANKLINSFVDILPRWLEDDMLYPAVHTCPFEDWGGGGAETGRFAYSDPPLQQVSKRDPVLGPLARQMFTSRHGRVHGADFDQVELRVAAALAGDAAYLEAFHEGRDPHREAAASTLGIPLADVTKDQRQKAKAVPFGLINGMGAKRLAVTTGQSVDEAKRWIGDWEAEHPELAEFLQKTWRDAERTEVAMTVAGRRRVFPKPRGSERTTLGASSTVVSGTAAELMRAALREAERDGHEPILSMHDELLGQSRLKRGADLATLMTEVADAAFPEQLGAVSFTASGGEGPTWYDTDG